MLKGLRQEYIKFEVSLDHRPSLKIQKEETKDEKSGRIQGQERIQGKRRVDRKEGKRNGNEETEYHPYSKNMTKNAPPNSKL